MAVPGGYHVAGTDVASVNPNVDWNAVAGSPDVRFAYVKAAEGLNFIDPDYTNNVHSAKAQGLLVGAYDFARPDQGSPAKQADAFADKINYSTSDGQTLPPFVDLEYGSTAGVGDNCYYDSPSEMVSFIKDYLAELTKRIGRKPMIYTGVGWWEPCTGSSKDFGDYPLDVSDYDGSSPQLPSGWNDFTFWQYSDNESFGSKNYDGDVYNGTLPDLRAFANGHGSSSPSAVVQPSNGQLAVSFRAQDTGRLWTWNGPAATAGTGTSTNLGLAPGTSPAITVLANGNLAVAFHANDGYLWTWTGAPNSAGQASATGYGLADGSNPSIAALPSGAVAVAFAANDTGKLWTWTGAPATAGTATATAYGIQAGTNPSVAVLPTGQLAVAFEANSSRYLWTWTGTPASAGTATSTGCGVQAGSSPSTAVLPTGKLAVAFQANSTQALWTWIGTPATPATTNAASKTGYSIQAGTSPSVAVLANGQLAVAFEGTDTQLLWTWTGAAATAGTATKTGYSIQTGTSPSLTVRPNSYLAVAFNANDTNKLWTWTGTPATTGTATATPYGIG